MQRMTCLLQTGDLGVTCIVGLTDPHGQVFIGADSCASSSDSWTQVSGPKVFSVDGRFLIGACGSFRAIDLLRFSLHVGLQPDDMSDDAFMRTRFIAAWRKLLLDEGFLYRENMRESGSNFMVGYRGQLFEIQSDFSVLNAPSWGLSVGSGENAARGSLFTTRRDWDCRHRIQQALEAAEAVSPGVRGPFVIMDAP